MTDPERNPLWDAKDQANGTWLFYTYMLELDDGADYYVGHTDDLKARLAEHALGNTAATAGRAIRLVWFETRSAREDAAKLEARMKRAVKRSPERVRPFCQTFRSLCELIAPRPTLEELEQESRERESRMMRAMHFDKGPQIGSITRAFCGWYPKYILSGSRGVYATDAWANVTCADCLDQGGMVRIPPAPAQVIPKTSTPAAAG